MAALTSAEYELFGDSGSDDDEVNVPTLLDRITIQLSPQECETGIFRPGTVSRASATLRQLGIVILPGLFDREATLSLGQAAVADLERAVVIAEARCSGGDYHYAELASRLRIGLPYPSARRTVFTCFQLLFCTKARRAVSIIAPFFC